MKKVAAVVGTVVAVVTLVGDASDRAEGRGAAANSADMDAFVDAGYMLLAPLGSRSTFLVDMDWNVVQEWKSAYTPGVAARMANDTDLLRTGRIDPNPYITAAGVGGKVERINWNDEVVWHYELLDENNCLHHDIEPLPNGNILMLLWVRKTTEEAIAAGRDPDTLTGDVLWADSVIEVKPTGREGGEIVWRWDVWDHLVQEFDETKDGFGEVADHPGRIDVNFITESSHMSSDSEQKLRSLGYVGGQGPGGPRGEVGPWTHVNSVDYHPELDQIVLSVRGFCELWVIDHSITTEGAAGSAGDLLYRWGNPRAYGAGGKEDQVFFTQHDARWVPAGYPGEGNLMVFNNGSPQEGRMYSSVDEITPPLKKDGSYKLRSGRAFGPEAPTFTFTDTPKTAMFSAFISGAQRLPNGQTLICAGLQGDILAVDAEGWKWWEHTNPFKGDPSLPNPSDRGGQGRGGPGGMGGPGGRNGPPGNNSRPMGGRGPGGANGPGSPGGGMSMPPGMQGGPGGGMGPGGRGGPGRMVQNANAIFRVEWIAPDHPGLAEKLGRAN